MESIRAFGAIAALLTMSNGAFAAEPTAGQQIAAAEALARKEHKNVFVIIHASWCGWCHRLEGAMSSPDLKRIFDANYVIVPIDIQEHDAAHPETPGGAAFAKEIGAFDQGLPFYEIVNPEGRNLCDSKSPKEGNIGYPGSADEIAYFVGMIRSTAKYASVKQIGALDQYLREHAPKG